jgi:hypothetical protein
MALENATNKAVMRWLCPEAATSSRLLPPAVVVSFETRESTVCFAATPQIQNALPQLGQSDAQRLTELLGDRCRELFRELMVRDELICWDAKTPVRRNDGFV